MLNDPVPQDVDLLSNLPGAPKKVKAELARRFPERYSNGQEEIFSVAISGTKLV